MCGIIGYISLDDDVHAGAKRHFADYALMLDTLRGADSTGIIRVNNEFDIQTLHTTAAGRDYVATDEYDEWMNEQTSWAFVGHNRAATAGSVKIENAHPFTFGDVTMVHNGTLTNQGRSVPNFDESLEVDSMQIARALSEVGPDHKSVGELLGKIDGSYALVWVDRRDDSINMCRNSSRPLHFAFNRDKDIMWFMSDGTHLKAITKSLGRDKSAIDTIYSMDKNKLLKFKKGEMQPEVTDFAPFVAPVYQYNTRSSAVHGGAITTDKERGSALMRAAERWGAGLTGGRTRSTRDGKCLIGSERRRVPENHSRMLQDHYELKVDELVEFEPHDWMELDDKKCVVSGTFVHPDWVASEWPCTLYNVPLVICQAYGDRNWAVRAKGVSASMTPFHSQDIVALLGELYSHDGKSFFPNWEDDTPDATETEQRDTGLVEGPDGRLMERGLLLGLLSQGCIQCGSPITWEERTSCLEVNEGRDVLCPDCHTEWCKEA